jgi:DNA-binding MarR family transcriptional regulator
MSPTPLSEYEGFFRELRTLLYRLRVMGTVLHGENALSIGERSLLTSLELQGARTIPDLARTRSVSRQHIQALSKRLLQEGWIAVQPNPAHQRSHLLELTTTGRARLAALRTREETALAGLELPFRAGELDDLAAGLRHVREVLEQVSEKRPRRS